MNRHILAWVASAALLGAAGAAPAMADGTGATQALGQSASNQQSASSDATSTQYDPSNQNISVRVLSPGNNGPVTQTNSSQALSAAGNLNTTSQSASQTQGGGGGTQAADQTAASKQSADADASSTQVHPSNQNIDVRVLSPGNDGSVSQTNASQADALAGNANKTEQTADQTQGGGGGTQAADQQAYNQQKADADAKSKQVDPSNQNIGVRVLSPGNDGSVSQTNASQADALAGNANKTTQDASQNQGASQPLSGDRCQCGGGDSTGIQAVGQDASNRQSADASASSTQIHPSNVNTPVRVLSPGDNGKVEQANVSDATAVAGNLNTTDQSAEQNQYGSTESAPAPRCEYGCDGHGDSTGIQAVGQSASNKQDANANADSQQTGASNVNAPVRVGSEGDNGKVEQANVSFAAALAGNANTTDQSAEQNQGGGIYEAAAPRCDSGCGDHSGTAIQAAGQEAYSDQKANADASSKQTGASNVNAPVRVGSEGDNGSVEQLNASGAEALAFNLNHTDQSAEQEQSGSGHGTAIQALGQEAGNKQDADADATSEQICPVNLNAPVDVGSQDHMTKSKYSKAPKASKGGSVKQANLSGAASAAGNKNHLSQWGSQHQ